ncbi:MAG: hypothetical protein A2539_06565 [Elusimicrobia bacterium RIFOXYD2_FULL_34_15]|nr:MAG: hypothetical protein A2539_06565 [Elusimicrobia bacterium RIFOXYD2_FULL_34_15]
MKLQKNILVLVLFLNSMYLYSAELSESTETYKMILTPYATYPVMVEEYMPKVIVEGMWGTEHGEFGKSEWGEQFYEPQSMIVDSKGNIYILDTVNNRIQKFDSEGKYLLSIPVESFKGKTKYFEGKPIENPYLKEKYLIYPIEVYGINIVIDSNDNLYYYFERNKKGEVWQFKDDKFIKKWEVEAGNSLIVKNDRLFLNMDKYYLDINTEAKYKEIPDDKSEYSLYLSSSESGLPERIINIKSKSTNKITKIDLSKIEYPIRYYGFLTPNEIYVEIYSGKAENAKSEIFVFNLEGKLIKKLEGVPIYYIDKYYFYDDMISNILKVIKYVPKDK